MARPLMGRKPTTADTKEADTSLRETVEQFKHCANTASAKAISPASAVDVNTGA